MWVSAPSPCSFYPAFPLSRRRLSRLRRTGDTRSTSCATQSVPLPPSDGLPRSSSSTRRQLIPGGRVLRLSPPSLPPDRLKLQSVASPSVGTLIRGRLHCSGTLLAALGYQLFPRILSFSLFLRSSARSRCSVFLLSVSTAVASFFVLLSEDLRIHGRSLRFLIIPA